MAETTRSENSEQTPYFKLPELPKREPEKGLSGKLLAGLAWAAALWTCVLMCITAYVCYSPVPWGDMWDFWAWYQKYSGSLFWHLADQHNEHRLIIANLFFLFDKYCCSGTELSLAIFIPCIQFGHAIALWYLIARYRDLRRSTKWFLGAISLTTMFASQQFSNFTWYFQIQFVAVYFGATLCCLCLLKSSDGLNDKPGSSIRDSGRWLSITIALAFCTTYSMANGLLIWPVLLSLSYLLKLSRRYRGILLAFWITSWITYFIGYHSIPGHTSPLSALSNLPQLARFFLTVLGSPFSDAIAAIVKGAGVGTVANIAAVLGFAGLIASAALSLVQFLDYQGSNDKRAFRPDLIYIHLQLFVICSVALIASGRFSFPINEALTSRYTTPALLFWLFLTSLAVSSLGRKKTTKAYVWECSIQTAASAIFFFFLAVNKPADFGYPRGYAQYLGEAEAAISNNVFDRTMWLRANYNLDAELSLSDFLRQNHLSVLANPLHSWIGQKIGRHYTISSSAGCLGALDSIVPILASDRSGYRVKGWGLAKDSESRPQTVLLTDSTGVILGSGATGSPRPDVSANLKTDRAGRSGWTAYVSGLEHKAFTAYLILPDSEACAVGSKEVTALTVSGK